MEWKAYDFTLPFGETIFYFTPLECLKVAEFIVIKYKLKVNELEAIIPYYVSNGKTNELRANMLFPFMNFNEREKLVPSCPSSFSHVLSFNGLLKYNIIKNMDSTLLDLNILRKCNFTKEEMASLSPQGIKTIFRRINNILDFIIGCFTPMILEFDETRIDCYFPQSIPNEYNPDSCIVKPYFPATNTYRRILLLELQELSHKLFKDIHLSAVQLSMPIQEMRRDSFNQSLNICHTDYQSNVRNYRMISDLLAFFIKPFLPGYIIDNQLPHGNELTIQMKGWDSTCRPSELPMVYIISTESNPMIQFPVAPIENFRSYSIIDEPYPSLQQYLNTEPPTRLKKTLQRYDEKSLDILELKKGLTFELSQSILLDIDTNKKPAMLFIDWRHVISLSNDINIGKTYSEYNFFDLYVGGGDRIYWMKQFFLDVISRNVSITIFIDIETQRQWIEMFQIDSIEIIYTPTYNYKYQFIVDKLSKHIVHLGTKSKYKKVKRNSKVKKVKRNSNKNKLL